MLSKISVGSNAELITTFKLSVPVPPSSVEPLAVTTVVPPDTTANVIELPMAPPTSAFTVTTLVEAEAMTMALTVVLALTAAAIAVAVAAALTPAVATIAVPEMVVVIESPALFVPTVIVAVAWRTPVARATATFAPVVPGFPAPGVALLHGPKDVRDHVIRMRNANDAGATDVAKGSH